MEMISGAVHEEYASTHAITPADGMHGGLPPGAVSIAVEQPDGQTAVGTTTDTTDEHERTRVGAGAGAHGIGRSGRG